MDKATEIPMNDCGLKINVGRDGCWLHFSSEAGVSSSINVNILADRQGIIGKGLREWCEDRVKQANQLDAQNRRPAVTELEYAIRRERLSDELRALQYVNIARLPDETYEQNLERRARIRMRENEILAELAG